MTEAQRIDFIKALAAHLPSHWSPQEYLHAIAQLLAAASGDRFIVSSHDRTYACEYENGRLVHRPISEPSGENQPRELPKAPQPSGENQPRELVPQAEAAIVTDQSVTVTAEHVIGLGKKLASAGGKPAEIMATIVGGTRKVRDMQPFELALCYAGLAAELQKKGIDA